jgi:hypothetical protein
MNGRATRSHKKEPAHNLGLWSILLQIVYCMGADCRINPGAKMWGRKKRTTEWGTILHVTPCVDSLSQLAPLRGFVD